MYFNAQALRAESTGSKRPRPICARQAGAGAGDGELEGPAAGHHPPPPGAPETPGLEASGKVVAVGQAATGFREGDEVAALLPGGGYAEYAVATAANAVPRPKELQGPKGPEREVAGQQAGTPSPKG